MSIGGFFQRSELARTLATFKREFFYAALFTALTNLLMLAPTLYMLNIFDRVLVSQSAITLLAVTLVLVFLLSVMAFAEWIRSRLLVRLGVRLDMTLNKRVFSTAFEVHGQGGDGRALPGYLTDLRQFLTGAGLLALLDAPWTPIYILVLFMLHPMLGWLSIGFCLLLFAVARLSGRVMQEPLETAARSAELENRHLDARLRQASVIDVLGMMGALRRRWQYGHAMMLAQGRRGLDALARMQSLTSFVHTLQQSLTLTVGAVLVLHDAGKNGAIAAVFTTGAMIAANVLMSRATAPLEALVRDWKDVLAGRHAYRELEKALEAHPPSQALSVDDRASGASIQLKNVFADVPGRSEPILHEINVNVPAGIALGVKGPSGSGKSTLARVLLGIWPQIRGEVLFDRVPVKDLDRVELGAQIGYLPQDVEIFEGTLAENVARFGAVDSELVIEACKAAGVHDMILRFPMGYDQVIGDGGSFLSGGQRQRMGLARALYGNPRLVVLDEPNSSLDEAGDQALLQAVLLLKKRGATVILISHRPQIMAAMDKILLVEDGRTLGLEDPPGARPASAAPSHTSMNTAFKPASPAVLGFGAPPGASTVAIAGRTQG